MKRANLVAAFAAGAMASFPTSLLAASEADDVRPAEAAPHPIEMKLMAGAAYRRVFDLPFSGVDVGIAGGARATDRVAVFGTGSFFRGSTEHGLATTMIRVGANLDYALDRLRLLGGAEGMYLRFERVREGSISTFALGCFGGASVDVVQLDSSHGSAIFLAALFDVDLTRQGDIVWGPHAYVGFRFGSRGTVAR